MSILSNVKDRFGFGSNRNQYDDYDDYDEYDDYDDYEDDEYDNDDYSGNYDEDNVSPSGRVVPRSASGGKSSKASSWPETLDGGARRESRLAEVTPLVGNYDVRAKTYESSRGHSDSPMASSTPDYESSLQMYDIKPREGLGRNSNHSEESLSAAREELESLQKGITVPLSSSMPEPPAPQDSQQQIQPKTPPKTPPKSPSPSTATRRIVTVIPTAYSDVAKVSEAFKNGASAVVSFGAISPELACRVLDFCFGVVSVSGGSVEKIGSKAYFLSQSGVSITESEIQQLKNAGVL